MNILFVCTGNTCRSAMAEGIMKAMTNEHNVSSAGLMAEDGMSASPYAVEAAAEFDAAISGHKSRRITLEILEESDLVLCMTEVHKMALSRFGDKVYTLSEFAGEEGEISDPFGSNIFTYRRCASEIYELVKKVCEKCR